MLRNGMLLHLLRLPMRATGPRLQTLRPQPESGHPQMPQPRARARRETGVQLTPLLQLLGENGESSLRAKTLVPTTRECTA